MRDGWWDKVERLLIGLLGLAAMIVGLVQVVGRYVAPRYAISCVIEHGKAGANAGAIVKDVMEEVLRLDPSRKPRVDDQVAAATPAPERTEKNPS